MSRTEYDAVCIGAHPDDVEIGMGATVAKMTASGARVAIIDLTDGEPTPHGSAEIRARESAAAAEILGAQRRTLSQANRYLFDTVEARIELAEVLREFRPRMVFLPFERDAHPDHLAAARIGLAARFYSKFTKTDMAYEPFFPPRVFHYMAVHQRMVVEPSFIADVTGFVETKLKALKAYESQFVVNSGNAAVLDMVERSAAVYGELGRVGAGEPFFALEPVTLATPSDIL